MKVLWFTTCPCGSIYRNGANPISGGWIFSLEKELKKDKNIELNIAYFSQNENKPFSFDGVNYYPIRRTKMNNLLTRIRGRHSFKIIPECLSIINEVSPDLIHIHGTEHSFPLIIGHTDIPVVVSMQSILAPYADKYYSGIPQNIANRYDSLKLKLLYLGSKAMYRLTCNSAEDELIAFRKLRYIMGRTDWDFSISRLMAPLSKYYKCDEILRDEFYQNEWKLQKHKKMVLVTTMSDSIYKGLDVVYKTAKILKDFNIDFEWKVIGQSKGSNYERITQKFTGISPDVVNVSLEGRKKPQQIIDILLKTDIFVQVSHIENSPNSLCEAMLIGMPIIASYVGGTKSLLLDGKEGVLVQEADCFSYASKIIELFGDKNKMCEYGVNARQKALIRHNKARIVQQVLLCYNEMTD